MKPGEVYGPRINAVDMRFAKILRFGRTRTNVGIDLYNIFNTNTGTAFNQNFGVERLRVPAGADHPQPALPAVQRHVRLRGSRQAQAHLEAGTRRWTRRPRRV